MLVQYVIIEVEIHFLARPEWQIVVGKLASKVIVRNTVLKRNVFNSRVQQVESYSATSDEEPPSADSCEDYTGDIVEANNFLQRSAKRTPFGVPYRHGVAMSKKFIGYGVRYHFNFGVPH
eukprot:5664941-Amphidinium_carterae.1